MELQNERFLPRVVIITCLLLLPKLVMAQGLCSWVLGQMAARFSHQDSNAISKYSKFEFLKDVPVKLPAIDFPEMPERDSGLSRDQIDQIADSIREAELKADFAFERAMQKALETYTGFEQGFHPNISFPIYSSLMRSISTNHYVKGRSASEFELLNCQSGKCVVIQSIHITDLGNPYHYGDIHLLPLNQNEFVLMVSGSGLTVIRIYNWDSNKNIYTVREEIQNELSYGHHQSLMKLTDESLILQSNDVEFVHFQARAGAPSLSAPKVLNFYDRIKQRNLKAYSRNHKVIAIPLLQGGFAVTHPGAEIAVVQKVASGDIDVVQVIKSRISVYHSSKVTYLVQMPDGNLVSTYFSGPASFQIWQPR